jgi:hypothetical protein
VTSLPRFMLKFMRLALAFAEGALLVFPLLALWPFALVILVVENSARIGYLLVGLVVMALGATALVALLRLLGAFVISRGDGLRLAPRSWWILSSAGAGLVVLGTAVWLLEQSGAVDSGPHSPLGVSIVGIPALFPLLHMTIELRRAANKTMEPTR